MKSEITIGIDLGGTNIKGVLFHKNGQILERIVRKTEEHMNHWEINVRDMIQTLQHNEKGEIPIGISAPGIANEHQNAIVYMPGRLSGLENFRWDQFLMNKNIKVLNDAHASLLAEATFGSGKGINNLVMLTLGTGIGGSIKINGSVYKGFHGLAGHFGHSSLDSESDQLGITNIPGSLEDAFGESTILKRSHGKFNSIKEMVDAYLKGDHFATYLWLKSVKKLAIGICSICNIISPEMVILGGGITNAKEALFDPLSTFMDLYEWRPGGAKTIIKQAHFNQLAGAIGAASFAFENNQSNE